MDVEIPVDNVSKNVEGMISVGVFSNPVVGGRAVELRKEELLVSLAVVERAGEQCFKAVVKTAAVAHSAFVGIPASGFGGKFGGAQIAAPLGDRGKCFGTIDRGIRSTNDFNTVNQIDIDREFGTYISSVENVVVYAVSI